MTLAAPAGGRAVRQQVVARRASWSGRLDPRLSYEGAGGWLAVALGATADELVFSADPAGLSPGTYRAVATLGPDWPGTAQKVPVTFTVGDGIAVPAPQVRVHDDASSAASMAGSFPVRDTRGTALAWTAATSTPWLRLKAAAGTAGSAVEYEIDTARIDALPAFADVAGSVTIAARSAAGAVLAPVAAEITLRRETAQVQTATPAYIVAGSDAELIVRGRGFDRLSQTLLSRLTVGSAPVAGVQRLSDTTLKVALSRPPAGEHAVSLPGDAGRSNAGAVVRAVDARALPAAALPTGGSVRSVLHDAARQQVFVANTGLGAIQRFRPSAGGWTADRLALADLFDIGLSPDGRWLLATERSGKVHLVDPVSLAIGASYAAPGALYPIPSSGHGVAVTNDGRAWLTTVTGHRQRDGQLRPAHAQLRRRASGRRRRHLRRRAVVRGVAQRRAAARWCRARPASRRRRCSTSTWRTACGAARRRT